MAQGKSKFEGYYKDMKIKYTGGLEINKTLSWSNPNFIFLTSKEFPILIKFIDKIRPQVIKDQKMFKSMRKNYKAMEKRIEHDLKPRREKEND